MTRWKVNVWEFERGWGAKIDFTQEFDDYDAAEKYKTDFNAKNTELTAPDWYMQAEGPFPIKEEMNS